MKFLIIVLSLCFLCSCGKHDSTKLAQTHFKMAFLEASQQDKDPNALVKGLAHLEKALLYNKKPDYMALKATLLFKLGYFNKSKKSFIKALDLDPEPGLRAEIENNFACLLAQIGELTQAKILWTSVGRNPAYQTPEVAFVNVGKVSASENRLSDARDMFAKAINLSPSYIDAHFYKGLVSYQLSDMSDAREEMKVVLMLEPEHQGAKQIIQRLDNS